MGTWGALVKKQYGAWKFLKNEKLQKDKKEAMPTMDVKPNGS